MLKVHAMQRWYQQGEPGATARALGLINQVFEGLPCRDEDFLLQVFVIALTFTLPLKPDRHTHTHTSDVQYDSSAGVRCVTRSAERRYL